MIRLNAFILSCFVPAFVFAADEELQPILDLNKSGKLFEGGLEGYQVRVEIRK